MTSRVRSWVAASTTEAAQPSALVLEELCGDHRADGVQAAVLRSGRAAPIPVETGQRVGAAGLQWPAEYIAIGPIWLRLCFAHAECTS